MAKKKTSFTLETSLLKDLKMKAVQLETTQTKLIEQYLKESLDEEREHKIKGDKMAFQVEDIEPNILKSIRSMAKNKGMSEKETINILLKKGLKTTENKKDVFERLEKSTKGKIKIANKDTYNPNPSKKELNSIVGIVKAPKGVNPVQALLDLRNGKE